MPSWMSTKPRMARVVSVMSLIAKTQRRSYRHRAKRCELPAVPVCFRELAATEASFCSEMKCITVTTVRHSVKP